MAETISLAGAGDADDYFKIGALEAQHYANTGGNGYVPLDVNTGPEMYDRIFDRGRDRRIRMGFPLGTITLRRDLPPSFN